MASAKASSNVLLRALFETLADAMQYPRKNALLGNLPWAMQYPVQVAAPSPQNYAVIINYYYSDLLVIVN